MKPKPKPTPAQIHRAAQILGRAFGSKGGSVKSEAKTRAGRINCQKALAERMRRFELRRAAQAAQAAQNLNGLPVEVVGTEAQAVKRRSNQ